MVGDPALSSVSPGDLLSLVVQVTSQDSHAATLKILWTGEECRCADKFILGETLTLYEARYVGLRGNMHFLEVLSGTTRVVMPALSFASFCKVTEVCAGIGGIALGFVASGGHCTVVQDKHPLACATLRGNFPVVVEGDLTSADVRRKVHAALPSERCIVAASLSGFHFSVQGVVSASASPGVEILCSVLKLAWHAHASGLILESIVDLQQVPEAAKCLDNFMRSAGFRLSKVQLDLATQWASTRVRWWYVLSPAHLPALTLQSWPKSTQPWLVKHVIPEWPIWPEEEESALQWDSAEQAAYQDTRYGTEPRILDLAAKAPPAKHSWGNALRACPCGCRSEAISPESLLCHGLSGVGVPSSHTGELRFLHPAEAGILNALPPRHRLPLNLRSALCLVGQLSSPLQSLWISASLRAWASDSFAETAPCPLQLLGNFQSELLSARKDRWLTPSLLEGGEYSVRDEAGTHAWRVPNLLTAGELIAIEKAIRGPGHSLQVFELARCLHPTALLHPKPAGPTYNLTVSLKRARLGAEASADMVHDQAGLDVAPQAPASVPTETSLGPLRTVTPYGGSLASDASALAAEQQPEQGPASVVPIFPDESQIGVTDTALWCGLSQLIKDFPHSFVLLLPPTVAGELLRSAAATSSFTPELIAAAALPDDSRLLVPFLHMNHWTLLVLQVQGRTASAQVFDGIPGRNTDSARELAKVLCFLGGCCLDGFCEATRWTQQGADDCGAIVLAHAKSLLDPREDSDHLSWALSFLSALPQLPFALRGCGGLSTAQEQELQRLLVSKGVPQEAVVARLQAAKTKLGSGPLAEALSQKNVWQSLKAAASRPGALFKWVQPEELQAHIEQRAQTRFGTDVARPRAKKQRQARPLVTAPLHVDPQSLQLAPGSFVAKSGSPLGQLSFSEVQACATGVCFCSTSQVKPFLTEAKNLSVDALALVTTAELAADFIGLARVSSLRFPVIFAPTQEAILVSGSLVQLGDEDVQLAVADIAEVENIPTVVCRLSVFRDECKIPWDKFGEAPIRMLLQHVPEFQVCHNAACDHTACSAFHAAVDEEVEHLFLDIWARQWSRLAGGRAKPSEAEVFQAFARIPSSALPHAFRTTLPGLYLEPRASDGTGPHSSWAVVWLPGATAAQAAHALRTNEKAIGP